MGGGLEVRQPEKLYYYGLGGWDDYTWGGVWRICFVFSDSLQAGGSLFVSNGEGKFSSVHSVAWMAEFLPALYFAGIVCVAD